MDVRTIPHAEARAGRRPGAAGWLLAAPMFAWLVVFVVAPTVILFVYSFCQRDELGEVVFSFTLENYARVFDPTYLYIFWRSIWYAGFTTVICLVIGYPVAYFIGRAREDAAATCSSCWSWSRSGRASSSAPTRGSRS